MAHYENNKLGVSFDIADKFTVREQLVVRSKVSETAGESGFVRYWVAAQTVIENWVCEDIPDPAALDLDDETLSTAEAYKFADVVQWVANTVAGHMQGLETPSKN